jgi:hypothetical protein
MPNATVEELRSLRAWRTWLLTLVAFAQGAQYALNPAFPLASQSYRELRSLGEVGWVALGGCLMVVGVALMAAPPRWRWVAHGVGAFLYLMLAVASGFAGVVPAVLLLPAGLHLGEVRLWAWHRREGR